MWIGRILQFSRRFSMCDVYVQQQERGARPKGFRFVVRSRHVTRVTFLTTVTNGMSGRWEALRSFNIVNVSRYLKESFVMFHIVVCCEGGKKNGNERGGKNIAAPPQNFQEFPPPPRFRTTMTTQMERNSSLLGCLVAVATRAAPRSSTVDDFICWALIYWQGRWNFHQPILVI